MLDILAQNVDGITIGTGAVGVIAGVLVKQFVFSGKGKFNRELCDERHRNLEGWMERINDKLDDLLDKDN